MGKIMEALFCIFYLIFTSIMGVLILKESKKCKEYVMYGIMTLALVSGDAFHLVPRIIVALHLNGDSSFAGPLGIGKLVTSITMTIFYLIMYMIYEERYQFKNIALKVIMYVLTICRIALCLLPQNDWTGEAPVIWGVYRNIPFSVMGIIMVVLYAMKLKDKEYRFMALAITLSFAFYWVVVLWADVHPMIGMMMLPKTIMYIWIVVMGYRALKKKNSNI